MRELWRSIAIITIPPLLFLWLRSLQERTGTDAASRSWVVPLWLALGAVAIIPLVFRLAHRASTSHRR